MSRPRTVALGLAVWCAVVALVASLVWVVIARAGAGVLPTAEPRPDVTGSLPVPGSHATRSPGPGATHSHHPSSPSGSGSSPASSPSATTTTAPPAPVVQRRSWSGVAGHVVGECRGPASRLVSAYPNTGWRYQILSGGPAAVQVGFVRIGEDHGITVTARCVGGVPEFSVSGRESGDR
jgi:hypothetical protein